MSQDFTRNLIWSALENYVQDQIDSGLSQEEIQTKVDELDVQKLTIETVEQIAKDCISSIQENMYERVLEERANATQFMAHNEQIWQKGFSSSEMLYIIVIETVEPYCEIFDELSDEKKESMKYRYTVLRELHGRACQEFLEILYLLKAGFADGAYARWRSMYELCIVAEFVRQNGEDVAKAYYEESFVYEKEYNWATKAPCFAGKRNVNFNMIQQQCSTATEAWIKQYRLSNKVLHAAPQGTFSRLGKHPETKVVAIGQSDYGIAMPAVNSAITLAIISALFFNMLSSGDGSVYSMVISKWVEIVRKIYEQIEKNCFESDNRNE